MARERRKIDRRNFSYYIPVTDAATTEQVGIMTDISLGGFKLDSQRPIPEGQVNRLRLNLTNEIASQESLVFVGRSKWCQPDYIDPSTYNVGFEVVNMTPSDAIIFQRMFEKYGSKNNNNQIGNYLWT
jgi:hypothetical protein